MHDAIAFERHGTPTAVILTNAFLHEADIQREALGADWLEPAVITHPLSTLTDDEIMSRAVEAIVQVKQILTTT